jgi:DNA-binding NtrC family response regulator
MARTGNILIVDDEDDILTAGRILLRRQFAEVTTCRNPDRIPDLMARHDFDVVLLDMNFGPGESTGEQGLNWLQKILDIDPRVVVIMVTAHGSVNTAVDAMKFGATDFISKPWQNEKVVATVSAGVELHRSRVETASLRQTNQVLSESVAPGKSIVGDSDQIAEVLSIVDLAAPTDANVLILGENGTGKELIARELHRRSSRADRVFLPVDMGSIAETLFESELFGHVKGAFTGADADRLGRFQAADGGTLFLDEIGNVPLHLQAKLLSAIEQREVTPVGSNKSQAVDVRIVTATNVSPNRLRNQSHFRQDLLYRLNTVEVTVPPLRDRREDIMPIARHYVTIFSRKYDKPERQFSAAAEKALVSYDWPGNVRSLRHSIERALILAKGETLEPGDLQLDDFGQLPSEQDVQPTFKLDELEKDAVNKALLKHGFNISKAANELGLTRTSLYRRMEKYDI